jgi:hypothetical protein
MTNSSSLQQALSFLSLLRLHWSLLGNGSQRRKFFCFKGSRPCRLATVLQLNMAANHGHCLPPSHVSQAVGVSVFRMS